MQPRHNKSTKYLTNIYEVSVRDYAYCFAHRLDRRSSVTVANNPKKLFCAVWDKVRKITRAVGKMYTEFGLSASFQSCIISLDCWQLWRTGKATLIFWPSDLEIARRVERAILYNEFELFVTFSSWQTNIHWSCDWLLTWWPWNGKSQCRVESLDQISTLLRSFFLELQVQVRRTVRMHWVSCGKTARSGCRFCFQTHCIVMRGHVYGV